MDNVDLSAGIKPLIRTKNPSNKLSCSYPKWQILNRKLDMNL